MPPERRERLVAWAGLALSAVAALAIATRVAAPKPIDAALAALPSQRPSAHRPATPLVAPRGVNLSITLWTAGPGHRSRSWVVACPTTRPACTAALGHGNVLRAGEAPGQCHAPAGGVAEAMIVGTVRGRPVDTWLDQRDPCDAEAWARLRALLTPPKAVQPPPRAAS